MATSGNPTFTTTRADIIRDAYAMLNLYGADENISNADQAYADRLLNRMIKHWMAKGYHLWLKQTVVLFTKQDQLLYRLSSTSSDHATDTYYETTLSSDAITGASSVDVADASNITSGDYIGVILNDNDIFWSTVDTVVTNTVTFAGGDTLPGDADSGKAVYNYTNKLDNPLNVYSAVRTVDNRDIEMNYLSYEEYFQLPNKNDTTSNPVSYNYDRQLDDAVIRIWPVPQDSTVLVKLTISRKIYNFDVNSNTPDLPEEWHEAIVVNLATRLAPAFGRHKDQGYAVLKNEADMALASALEFDDEVGSIYIRPNYKNA